MNARSIAENADLIVANIEANGQSATFETLKRVSDVADCSLIEAVIILIDNPHDQDKARGYIDAIQALAIEWARDLSGSY